MFTNIEFNNDFDFAGIDFQEFDFPSLDDYTHGFPEQTMSCESEITTSEFERILESADESKFDMERKAIYESASKLLKPSKKISKPQKRVISRQNGERFAPFFQKWKDLRKTDRLLNNEIKSWFSSFNMKLNKTYIYKEFFDSVRVHFRLAIRDDSSFNFQALTEADWRRLFINLTSFLMNEMNKTAPAIQNGKNSQVYPVWIEDINTFSIENLPSF